MKIHLVSDLHLDVSGHLEMPGGDVLIVAGDACEARDLVKEHHSTKTLYRLPGSFPCADFFEFECAKYKKVFYVLGNHEHYGGRYWKTYAELARIMPSNVTLLEDQYEEYQGVVFIGSTLWTDMNKSDPLTLAMIKDYMNDYRAITFHNVVYNNYRKLMPADTVYIHHKSKRYIEDTAKANADKPVVVITHMGPTHMSINEKFKHETISNGAYVSDLSNLILDNPNIKAWCHGHVHDPVTYPVGSCQVYCNPRGYLPYEGYNGFDPAYSFDV